MNQSAATTDPPARKPYTASNLEIYSWGLGHTGTAFMWMTFGLAGLVFNTAFGIDARLIGWALSLPRIIDAFTDPFIGNWSDNTHTRWGRRKPFLFAGAVGAAISISALWWPHREWSQGVQFAYLVTLATVFYFFWGMYNMSSNALGAELTDDYHERTRVFAAAGLFGTLISPLNGWIYWLALRPFFGGEINGIRSLAVLTGVLVVCVAAFPLIFCKERFARANRKHVRLIPAMRSALHNKPFITLQFMRITQVLGERLGGGMMGYVSIYYVCAGNKDLHTRIGGVGTLVATTWGLVLFPFMKRFSKKLGKRRGLIMGASTALASALLAPLIFNPVNPWLMIVPALLMHPISVVANTLTGAIMPDIFDIDELESGQRREGMFNSVVSFVSKMEISICVLLAGYLVHFSGFDPATAAKTLPSPSVLNHLRWFAFGPSITCAFLAFLVATRFKLTEARMNEVTAALQLQRAGVADPTRTEHKNLTSTVTGVPS